MDTKDVVYEVEVELNEGDWIGYTTDQLYLTGGRRDGKHGVRSRAGKPFFAIIRRGGKDGPEERVEAHKVS